MSPKSTSVGSRSRGGEGKELGGAGGMFLRKRWSSGGRKRSNTVSAARVRTPNSAGNSAWDVDHPKSCHVFLLLTTPSSPSLRFAPPPPSAAIISIRPLHPLYASARRVSDVTPLINHLLDYLRAYLATRAQAPTTRSNPIPCTL